MCDPVTIGTALGASANAAAVGTAVYMGVGQAALSIIGQKQQAKAQEQAQARASAAEQQRLLAEMSATRLRERQEMTAMAQKTQQAVKKGKEARARGIVSASESGVTGISVDALINDLTRQQGEYQFSLTQQAGFNTVNRNLGLTDAVMRSRNNQLRINRPINQPNYLGAVLDGAQTGMTFASSASDAGLFQGSSVAAGSTSSGYPAGATDLVNLNPNQAYS